MITNNEVFNYFLLTVDEFKSRTVFETARLVVVKGLDELIGWRERRAESPLLLVSAVSLIHLRWLFKLYEKKELLDLFEDRVRAIAAGQGDWEFVRQQRQQEGLVVPAAIK